MLFRKRPKNGTHVFYQLMIVQKERELSEAKELLKLQKYS